MRMVSKCALLAIAVVVGTIGSVAQAADSIVGTWRMISWSEQETESKTVHKPFGDKPLGLITFTADGRMMVMFTDPARKASAAPKATDPEAAGLYRSMVSYAGSYSLEGDKLTNKIEIAWNQAWNGTSQQRIVALAGHTLTVKTAPFVSPFLGKEIVATLVFERAK